MKADILIKEDVYVVTKRAYVIAFDIKFATLFESHWSQTGHQLVYSNRYDHEKAIEKSGKSLHINKITTWDEYSRT